MPKFQKVSFENGEQNSDFGEQGNKSQRNVGTDTPLRRPLVFLSSFLCLCSPDIKMHILTLTFLSKIYVKASRQISQFIGRRDCSLGCKMSQKFYFHLDSL